MEKTFLFCHSDWSPTVTQTMQSKYGFLFKILFAALDKTLFPILLTWTRTLTFNQLLVQLLTHSRWGCLWICHLTRTLLPTCRSWQAFQWQFQLIQLHSSKQITINSSLSFKIKPSIFLKAFISVLLLELGLDSRRTTRNLVICVFGEGWLVLDDFLRGNLLRAGKLRSPKESE